MKFKRGVVVGVGSCLICLLVGGVVGSYVEFMSRTAKNYRRIVTEYQQVRDNFHLTDAEMAEAGKKMPQFLTDMEIQDGVAAFQCLTAFKKLEKGDIEGTKVELLRPIGAYTYVYAKKGGDPDTMKMIDDAAKEYPEIAEAIAKWNKPRPMSGQEESN